MLRRTVAVLVAMLLAVPATAQAPAPAPGRGAAPPSAQAPGLPAPPDYRSQARQGDHALPGFGFHRGGKLDLKVHYSTWGTPRRGPDGKIVNAILLAHGTGGDGLGFGAPWFGGRLFGPGEPLDIARGYVIAVDDVGAGRSTKPSDGLRARFPRFDLEDVVETQRRVLTEALGVDHLLAVVGISLGGRNVWQWGVQFPGFASALVPVYSSPFPNSGRRGMIDLLAEEAVTRDPSWRGGDYEKQPEGYYVARLAYLLWLEGVLHLDQVGRSREEAYAWAGTQAAAAARTGDANDWIYGIRLNDGFDAAAKLEKVTARVLIVNGQEDELVPTELRHLEQTLARLPRAESFVVANTSAFGHLGFREGVDVNWGPRLGVFLRSVEREARP